MGGTAGTRDDDADDDAAEDADVAERVGLGRVGRVGLLGTVWNSCTETEVGSGAATGMVMSEGERRACWCCCCCDTAVARRLSFDAEWLRVGVPR